MDFAAHVHRKTLVTGAFMLALALAGCGGSEPKPAASANVTNAPVGAGINIVPGSKEDYIVNVGRRTYFSDNSAALSEASKDTLDRQAAFLIKHTRYKARIQGFADDSGGNSENMEISRKRADAVKAYLVSKGVAEGRLRVKAYGNSKDRLVNDCADISCKSQNRRVVTNLDSEVDS
jgi:peptidoglycan-associated lipoprotein